MTGLAWCCLGDSGRTLLELTPGKSSIGRHTILASYTEKVDIAPAGGSLVATNRAHYSAQLLHIPANKPQLVCDLPRPAGFDLVWTGVVLR